MLDPRPSRPLTRKGERTRRALVDGARRVFERDGYHEARLADIAAESGVSVGTFYLYFDQKDQVLAAVLQQVEDEMIRAGRPSGRSAGRQGQESGPPYLAARIAAANRAYFAAYRERAGLMLLLEEVATLSPEFRRIRSRRGWSFTERNAACIARLQQEGLVDPGLDPVLAARALSGMVARMAYHEFVLVASGRDHQMDGAGDGADALDRLTETATRLWVNGLGLRTL